MSNEELMLQKHEIVLTTNTRGWHYITTIAENTVKAMERTAIDEEDDAKGAVMRREAKAARQFLGNFLRSVEAMRRIEVPENTSSAEQDYDVAME